MISSLNVWCNSLVNISGPDTFCSRRLLIIDSISLTGRAFSYYLLLLSIDMAACVFQGVGSFMLGIQICRQIINCS